MVTEICVIDYILNTYHDAKFHYDLMRGFCPSHMQSRLPSLHSVTFLGFDNSLPPRLLHQF